MGILNFFYKAQSPEERECRRESESLGLNRCRWHLVVGKFVPFDESKYNTLKLICQYKLSKKILGQIRFVFPWGNIAQNLGENGGYVALLSQNS